MTGVRVPRAVWDVAPAVVFCLLDVVFFSHVLSRGDAPVGSDVPPGVVIAYAAAGYGALALRRRHPVGVFVVMWGHAAIAWQAPLLGYTPTLGLLVALYSVAVLRGPAVSLQALLASFVPAAVVVAESARLAPADKATATLVTNAVFYVGLGVTVWGVGNWAGASRRHARNLEFRREIAAREAVAAERGRIARELHDIVAHSVTVMVLQAGGAQQVLDHDTARAGEALGRIEDLGKQAMAELRRMLVVLRASDDGEAPSEDGHQPGLADLDELLRTFRDAGLPVRLKARGDGRRLDRSVDLTAYRVVQEALTNVVKHAGPGTRTTVDLDWTDRLLIQVTDSGTSTPGRGIALSTGHGLLGLRERVSVAGGTLDAGHTPGGGFRVTAALPAPVHSRDDR